MKQKIIGYRLVRSISGLIPMLNEEALMPDSWFEFVIIGDEKLYKQHKSVTIPHIRPTKQYLNHSKSSYFTIELEVVKKLGKKWFEPITELTYYMDDQWNADKIKELETEVLKLKNEIHKLKN